MLAPERQIVVLPPVSWGSEMNYYRLYFMHSFSGHIERVAEFDAPDDDAAATLAGEHLGEAPLELWCEHRKVRRFEAPALAPASAARAG